MSKTYEPRVEQLELLMIREDEKHAPAKRVDIVSVKLVREKTMLYKDRKVRSPQDAYEIMKQFLGDVDREHFVVLAMDVKGQPTCIQTVHIGSLSASIVHPREVLKSAILSNAASIICGHNHPSNRIDPSPEDIDVTKRLVEAGQIIGIDVLDHLILCEDNFRSFKESGYM